MSNTGIKRTAGWLCLATLAVFIANVVIGKYRIATGTGLAAPLDGVPEFIILVLSVSFLVVCMLFAGEETDQ